MARYRDIVSPVGVDVMNQNTGGAQAAEQLSRALKSFEQIGNQYTGQLRAEQGAQEGEAAGAARNPQPRTGLRAGTAYGRAYNSAAEAAYAAEIETDINATLTKLEQDHEGDLIGFESTAKGYGEELLKSVPDAYKVRVSQSLMARAAAGSARVRGQQIAYDKDKQAAAALAGMDARAANTLAAAEHLDRDAADEALAAAVAENQAMLDAMVAEHVWGANSAEHAAALQNNFVEALDKGLLASRADATVDSLMNKARVDVVAGDRALLQVLSNDMIPEEERQAIRIAYDKQRTALGEDRARAMVEETTGIARDLAAGDGGPTVDSRSWRAYKKGGISRAELEGNLTKSAANLKQKGEDSADEAAVRAAFATGEGIDPTSGGQKKALNKFVDSIVASQGMKPGDPRWTNFMVDVATQTNVLPASAESWARKSMLTGDPTQAALGASLFARVKQAKPEAWDYNSDPKLTSFAEQLNQNVEALGPDHVERAFELAHRNVFEQTKEVKERLALEYGSEKDRLDGNADALKEALEDDPLFDQTVWGESPAASLAMKADYDALVGQYYVSTNGDIKMARDIASGAIRSRYGVSEVNGAREIMKYAPEKMFPGLSGAVVRDDVLKSIATTPGLSYPDVVYPSQVKLVPEKFGLTERTQGRIWNIVVQDSDGNYDIVRGPDNTPLPYSLPLGKSFDEAHARESQRQIEKAQALKARIPIDDALMLEQLDDVRR